MYNLDEEKLECTIGKKEFYFWHGKYVGRECCVFISGFCTHSFYFFLTLVLPNLNFEIINVLSYFLVFDQGIIFLYTFLFF